MINLSVVFDYSEEAMSPIWMIVKAPVGGFDWNTETFYIPLESPFQRIGRYDIDECELGLSIIQSELTVNNRNPNSFGIYIPRVKQRINYLRGQQFSPKFLLSDIRHFVIQMNDIETIMQMNLWSIYDWR